MSRWGGCRRASGRVTRLAVAIVVVAATAVSTAHVALALGGGTYQGGLTITAGGASSISEGDNNCSQICGAPNGSRTFCGTPALGAHIAPSTGGNVTVSMGTTRSCSAMYGQNHLAANTTYDVNFINVDSMNGSNGIDNSEKCLSGAGNQTVTIATAVTDANGAFSEVVTLPSGVANSPGWSSGICVSDPSGDYGIEGGVEYGTPPPPPPPGQVLTTPVAGGAEHSLAVLADGTYGVGRQFSALMGS